MDKILKAKIATAKKFLEDNKIKLTPEIEAEINAGKINIYKQEPGKIFLCSWCKGKPDQTNFEKAIDKVVWISHGICTNCTY